LSSRAPLYPWWALARATASVAGWQYARERVGRTHRYTVLDEHRPLTALCSPRVAVNSECIVVVVVVVVICARAW
jgi:hypothetical protein